jgi:hypothetical protein
VKRRLLEDVMKKGSVIMQEKSFITTVNNSENKISKKIIACIAAVAAVVGAVGSFIICFEQNSGLTGIAVAGVVAMLMVIAASCVNYLPEVLTMLGGVVLFVADKNGFLAGVQCLCNFVIDRFNARTGLEVYSFVYPDGVDADRAYKVMGIYLIIVLSVLVYKMCVNNHKYIFTAVNIGTIATLYCFGTKEAYWCVVFCVLAVMGMLMMTEHPSGDCVVVDEKSEKRVAGVYVATCVVIVFVFGLYVKNNNFQRLDKADTIKDNLTDCADDMLYNAGKLPKGNLYKAISYEGSKDKQIEVRTDVAGVYYLKGYVGEDFDNNRWHELDYSNYTDFKGVFSWMAENGFDPFTQNVQYVESMGAKLEYSSVEIVNVAADTKYQYIPYGISCDELSFVGKTYKDINVLGSAGKKEQSNFKVWNYTTGQGLVLAEGEQDGVSNVQTEYRGYVYERYLGISDEYRKFFENALPSDVEGYASVTTTIREWLAKETGAAPSETNDCLMYFIENGKKGNSEFFATAGTLMYRYYGIPARYVEGYMANAGEESFTGENYCVSLDGSAYHAWVEIYKDGFGWMPVDVTPGFYSNDMASQSDTISKPRSANSKSSGGQSVKENSDKKKNHDMKKIVLLMLAAVGIVLVFVLIYNFAKWCYIVLGRRILAKNPDVDVRMRAQIAYLGYLFSKDKKDEADLPIVIRSILQKYRYGKEGVTEEEYTIFVKYVEGDDY